MRIQKALSYAPKGIKKAFTAFFPWQPSGGSEDSFPFFHSQKEGLQVRTKNQQGYYPRVISSPKGIKKAFTAFEGINPSQP